MIEQDVLALRGFGVMDNHDLVPKVLRLISHLVEIGRLDQSALSRVVVVSPGASDWSVRYNPLSSEDQIDAVRAAVALAGIFHRVWGQDAFGPQTEETLRNVLLLLAVNNRPLTDIERVFRDEAVRRRLAHAIQIEGVRDYWERFSGLSEAMQRRLAEPVLNKLTVLLFDPRLRAMLDSAQSDLDLRRSMDRGDWVLFDLNKGELLDQTALLGSMFLLGLQRAVFSRTDTPETGRRPFTMYVDEFPSYVGSVCLEPLLNEGRKFSLRLVLAGQTMASIEPSLRASISTNVYTRLYSRISPDDAETAVSGLPREQRDLLAKQLISLPVGSALLVQGGVPVGVLKVPYDPPPNAISRSCSRLIERMKRNCGRPLDLTGATLRPQTATEPAVEHGPPSAEARPAPNSSGLDLEPGLQEGDQ
jgi:hypothetical protein